MLRYKKFIKGDREACGIGAERRARNRGTRSVERGAWGVERRAWGIGAKFCFVPNRAWQSDECYPWKSIECKSGNR